VLDIPTQHHELALTKRLLLRLLRHVATTTSIRGAGRGRRELN
jgi:hypothetical protein